MFDSGQLYSNALKRSKTMHTMHGMHAPHTAGRTIRWAQHYDTVVTLMTVGRARTMRQATINLAHIQPGERVLDVGCGTGDLTLLAKSAAGPTGEVYGIDASPEMIQVAHRKAAQAGIDIAFQVEVIERL